MSSRKKGKFNIFDLLVIIIVVVLIGGAVYKFKGLDKTSNTTPMETMTYEMTIENLRPYAKNNLQVGDVLYDYTSGNSIGTITDIEWLDATDAFYTIDGKTVAAPVENRLDAVMTVEAQAVKTNGVYFVDKTYEVCVNSKRKVFTKFAEFTAVISDVN